MVDIRQRTCSDCAINQPCKLFKAGWVLIEGALTPFWGCVNIKLRDQTKVKAIIYIEGRVHEQNCSNR